MVLVLVSTLSLFNYFSSDVRTYSGTGQAQGMLLNYLARPSMMQSLDDADAIRAFINERTIDHTKAASQHRINQQAQNSSLQKASEVNMKMATMRKQSKSEKLDVLITLWMYPATGAAAKKVSIHCLL